MEAEKQRARRCRCENDDGLSKARLLKGSNFSDNSGLERNLS